MSQPFFPMKTRILVSLGVLSAGLFMTPAANAATNQSELDAAFMQAVVAGDLAKVKASLDAGASVHAHGDDNLTAILFATDHGLTDLAAVLLQAGALPDGPAPNGATPLMLAAGRHNVALARLLLEAGADPDFFPRGSKDRATPLMFAAFNGAADVAALLVNSGASITRKSRDKKTAQELAEQTNHPEVARIIAAGLQAGAQDATTRRVRLRLAARGDDKTAVEALLAEGASANTVDNAGHTVLMIAIERQKIEIVRVLVAAKADLEAKDRDGATALIKAIQADYSPDAPLVKLLLDAGADPSTSGWSQLIAKGLSPLVAATDAAYGPKKVALLVAAGAEVNARDASGQTALHRAVRSGDNARAAETISALLAAKAEVNARDKDGVTPLWIAASAHGGKASIVELLVHAGADVNLAASDGSTPLMEAAGEGDEKTVAVLLQSRANMAAKDSRGKTALDYARSREREASVALLERATAP
jgi:ankyrin repeat protein